MTSAIILSGGTGSRMETSIPKQLMPICGKPVIVHTLEVFQNHPLVDGIIVVIHPDLITQVNTLVKRYSISKASLIIPGGKTRQESSLNGLKAAMHDDRDILIFHDAVRPFVSTEIITRCIDIARANGAATAAVRTIDTVAVMNPDRSIASIPDRTLLWNIQTPQCFQYCVIRKAHELAVSGGISEASDDTRLVLQAGYPVFLAEGSYENIKITTPGDIERAEAIITAAKSLKKD